MAAGIQHQRSEIVQQIAMPLADPVTVQGVLPLGADDVSEAVQHAGRRSEHVLDAAAEEIVEILQFRLLQGCPLGVSGLRGLNPCRSSEGWQGRIIALLHNRKRLANVPTRTDVRQDVRAHTGNQCQEVTDVPRADL